MLVMTSWMPNTALRNPTNPAYRAETSIAEMMTMSTATGLGKSSMLPTMVATTQPMIYCPSAPILNRPVLIANATPRPVKMIGVERMITLEISLGLPIMLWTSVSIDSLGGKPASSRMTLATANPRTMAMIVRTKG